MDSLERLQGLHADLVAFTETRLANIDRLWQELEESLEEFRDLLDKSAPTPADRDAYNTGKITVGERDYGINDDFKHISRGLGTALDLDEIEAGKLLITGFGGDVSADQSFLTKAVSSFHDRRDLLLQSLRITLQESLNHDHDELLKRNFQDAVAHILNIKSGPPSNGSLFAAKCLAAMEAIEKWQVKIHDQLQSRSVLGEPRGTEFYSTLEFQRDSLFKQHEALGCIVAFLFRGNYTISEDLRKLHGVVKRWDRLDFQLVHYLPGFAAAFNQYGSPEGSGSNEDANSLNTVFGTLKQDWPNLATRPFFAALGLLWVADYSGWSRDRIDQDATADARADLAKTALDENALELLLSVCSAMTVDEWRHPARQEMVALLLSETPGLALEGEQTSFYFRLMMMESLDAFGEAWITNMPDTIRRLKNEEDDRRLLLITAMQEGLGPSTATESLGRLHLEAFLVLLSFAFEHRPAASELWWDDPDSNLYGFLAWASKRQTIPRASAFCEMLCAISEGPEGAAAAHKFLLDESAPATTARSRRVPSMNYQQIFAELDLYAHKVHERASTSQLATARKVLPTDMNEVESPVMLACYLRLLAHLCKQTSLTRDYIFGNASLDLPLSLLLLSSGPVPTYLRASVFATLDALLTDKDWQRSASMWKTLDQWASSGHDVLNLALAKSNQPPSPTLSALQNTLNSISISFDQYDAFILLLRSLLSMEPGTDLQGQLYSFPGDLGASYRVPGVGPYIDFVCGQIFVKRTKELGDETQARLSSFHCLDVVAIGLESFNESYVAMLDKTTMQGDNAQTQAMTTSYAQRHPFARLMYWVLGTEMNRTLIKGIHASLTDVEAMGPESPLILNMQRSIDIVNLVLDLQPTYNDIVRPMLKGLAQDKPTVGIVSLEDSIVAHPELILDLCQLAGSEHMSLALRSLSLLQKLSSSPGLNNHFLSSGAASGRSRRLIDMLGPNPSAGLKPVLEVLASRLQIDIRELEDGHEAPGYLIKDGITAFLNACLETQPDLPNLAHLLLGFERIGERLMLTSSFEDGTSVFDAILDLAQNYPDGEDGTYVSWLIHLKAASMQTLLRLWSSKVSADVVLSQLRRYRFLQSQLIGQVTVSHHTAWDGNYIQHPVFWYSTGAEALTEFLNFRGALYLYACEELRAAKSERLTTVLKQSLSTMLGKSTDIDGTLCTNASVFDLGDFMDLDLTALLNMGELQFFGELDLDGYMSEPTDSSPSTYKVPVVRELLQMYQSQLLTDQAQPQSSTRIDEDKLALEADGVLACLEARNRWILACKAKRETLHNYVNMVVALVECCPMEATAKMQFVLHLLQLILPKLDTFIVEESQDTIELARAAEALLLALAQTVNSRGNLDSIITDKLFQLFRTCVEGIVMTNSSSSLRTILYSICGQYLTRITGSIGIENDVDHKARNNSMDCIRSSSLRLINTLADDAEDGADTCRLNALLFLGLLASLARSEKSTYIVDSLSKANLLEILIEPLKHITADFQETEPAHRQHLLSIFEARMLLHLQVSRSRDGARAILDAGFIPAVRESMLFRADPDLGISLESEQDSINATTSVTAAALHNYYTILSSTLRVLLSVFLSRGAQNEQIQFLARTFLQDYRPNMVGVFKKYAGVNGKVDERSRVVLGECVKSYTGLVSLSGFVNFEDETALEGLRSNGFS